MLRCLVVVLSIGAAIAQGSFTGAAQREWRIRALTLDSRPIEVDVTSDWTIELEALEAFRRRLELGLSGQVDTDLLESARSCLADSSPNVRAAAVACLGLADSSDWSTEALARLAHDPLPEVRIELCRAVPPERWSKDLPMLSSLADSADLEVRQAARIALYRIDLAENETNGVALAQGAALTGVLRDEGPVAYLEELETWSRIPRRFAAPFPAFGAEEILQASDASGRELRGARALWLALSNQTLSAEAVQQIALGWCEPLSTDWERPHRIQQSLLLSLARRLEKPLAEALFETLARQAALDESVERSESLEWLFEGLLEAAEPEWIVARLENFELSDGDLRAFVLLADMRDIDWNQPIVANWLSPEREPNLRFQVADAAAGTFATGTKVPVLLTLLDDGQADVRQVAFQALCNASVEQLAQVEAPLFAAWRELPERLEALTQLPRARPLTTFRATLLALGDDELIRRAHPAIVELLGQFAGDRGCAAQLADWLAEDVAFLASASLTATREFRAVEVAARGEVRALHAAGGEEAVSELRGALDRMVNVSTDVAKIAAWCLGRSVEGRARIGDFMRDGVSTRVRVEVALGLVLHESESGSVRAFEVLAEQFENCDGELRGRILQAFAKIGTEAARDFALALMADVKTPVEQCAQAIEVLALRFDRERNDANFNSLESCVKLAPNRESLRLAIDALGRTRDTRATARLEALLSPGASDLDIPREATLLALARCEPNSSLLRHEIWRLPILFAESSLESRFQGKSVPAVAFSFRGEIEALRAVVRAKAWPLEKLPALERIDGRLALAFGQACREAEADEQALQLERAALVALAGEFPDDKLRFATHQARARLWAAAELAGRHFETAHFASRMLGEAIAGELSERDLEALLGAFDPKRGVDPAARLRASWFQARARLAWAAGDSSEASVLLETARQHLGFSRAAQFAQEAAERDLR